MSKYIKTPEERKMNMIERILRRCNRERALRERLTDSERKNRILQQRLERERERKLF